MSFDLPAGLVREGLALMAVAGGPLFATLLVVGLVVGVLQAATQINDPAMSFLPRLAAALLACWLLGSWMTERFAGYLFSAIERMGARPF